MSIPIEKRKETKWTLKLAGGQTCLEIIASEIQGVIESFGFSMSHGDATVRADFSEEEFLNFLSILNGFRQGVIGEESQNQDLAYASSAVPAGEPAGDDDHLMEESIQAALGNNSAGETSVPTGSYPDATTTVTPPSSDAPVNEGGTTTEEPAEEIEDPDLDPRQWDPW